MLAISIININIRIITPIIVREVLIGVIIN